ncbi:PAS domain S-box protein [Deinococcus roseus]|uniref:Histidine kinase n=1 Tax=Deinococcus roseus TaxID=392414 RepID=A0ABQ2D5W2_9DEIO|nr:PAS domain S-box protein [Deinococcus roseus]GGJ47204.1 hypothetical protein GCM10008938_36550 [Deinococcus roseus]
MHRTLLDHMTDVVVVLNQTGHVLYHNPSFQQTFGFAPEKGLQMHHWLHPEDLQVMRSFGLLNQLKGVPIALPPLRLSSTGGSWRWFEGTLVNLAEDPQVQGLLISLRDITLRIQAEQRAQKLHQFTVALSGASNLQEVVQVILLQGIEAMGAVAGGVMMADHCKGQVEVLGTVGYPEQLEKPWRIFPLNALTPAGEAIRQGCDLFLHAEDWHVRYPHIQHIKTSRSGRKCVLVMPQEGQPLGALTLSFDTDVPFSDLEKHFLRDMAARCANALHRAGFHHKLAGQERRYRKFTEHSHDIVSVLDLDGIVQYTSASMKRILGYRPEERMGLSGFMDIHQEDQVPLKECFQQALCNPGQPIFATYRFRHKEGHWVWLESSGTLCLEDEDVDGVLITTRDITTRKEAEQQMQVQLKKFQQLIDLTAAFALQQAPEQLVEQALNLCLDLSEYQQGFYIPLDRVSKPLWAGPQALSKLPQALVLADLHSRDQLGQSADRHHPWFTDVPLQGLDGWGSLALLPVLFRDTVQGVLIFGAPHFVVVNADIQKLLHGVSEQVTQAMHRGVHLSELKESREETLRAMGLMLEFRDYETKGHTDRVVQLSERLGQRLGFQKADMDALRWGAYLHDTGKISIPDHILLKPGKLDAQEWDTMKRHTTIGHELLCHIPSLPASTLQVVLHHHERWDGSGYPRGLAGKDIPLAARAFALVDVYDALTDVRPYKRAWTHQEAVEEIERTSGSHFDPHMARTFLQLLQEEIPQNLH